MLLRHEQAKLQPANASNCDCPDDRLWWRGLVRVSTWLTLFVYASRLSIRNLSTRAEFSPVFSTFVNKEKVIIDFWHVDTSTLFFSVLAVTLRKTKEHNKHLTIISGLFAIKKTIFLSRNILIGVVGASWHFGIFFLWRKSLLLFKTANYVVPNMWFFSGLSVTLQKTINISK